MSKDGRWTIATILVFGIVFAPGWWVLSRISLLVPNNEYDTHMLGGVIYMNSSVSGWSLLFLAVISLYLGANTGFKYSGEDLNKEDLFEKLRHGLFLISVPCLIISVLYSLCSKTVFREGGISYVENLKRTSGAYSDVSSIEIHCTKNAKNNNFPKLHIRIGGNKIDEIFVRENHVVKLRELDAKFRENNIIYIEKLDSKESKRCIQEMASCKWKADFRHIMHLDQSLEKQ